MNGFSSFKCALIALVLMAINFPLPNNNLSLADAQDDWFRSTPYKAYAPHFFYEMKDNDEVPRYIVYLTGDEILGYDYHVSVAYLKEVKGKTLKSHFNLVDKVYKQRKSLQVKDKGRFRGKNEYVVKLASDIRRNHFSEELEEIGRNWRSTI
jgi:hypothetical protein